MERILDFFSRRVEATEPEEEQLRVIIDKVLYEFHCPKRGMSPDVQIIFFHGMIWGDYQKAYVNTWKSVDGSLWPKTWLAEEFPNSSILSISYDSSLLQSRNTGRLDLHLIAENLLQILKENVVRAESRESCPIIMVGKDLGCLIIQAVCVKADEEKVSQLLTNLKGFFFYSSFQLEIPGVFKDCDGKLVGDLKQQMSRPFGKFLKLKTKRRWTVKVLHAANSAPRGKRIIDIPEDCARLGSDEFYSDSVDIYTITMPQSKLSQSFLSLRNFVFECRNNLQGNPSEFSFSSDLTHIPLKATEEAVKQAVTNPGGGACVTLLHGPPSSGKSALARNLALPALVAGLGNSENQELQTNSAGALADLASHGDGDLKMKISNFNGLLENLVTALGTDEAPALQAKAANAIWDLASNKTSFTIVGFPGLLPALVAGLDNSENQKLQTNSAGALADLACDGDGDLKMKITNVNGLLEKLVTALRTDEAPALQAQAARVICNLASKKTSFTIVGFPGLLPVLVVGLGNSENQELQKNSAGALADLASHGDGDLKMKISNFNGLLENLVTALGTDEAPALQAKAANAIWDLASNKTSFTIVGFPGLLPALVAGLDNSENQKLQTYSAGALADLACDGDGDLKMKITNVNGLLEKLVTALRTDEAPALQAQAARAICNLASNKTRSTIVGFPGLLPALVAGLDNSENQELQTNSVGALANLPCDGDGDLK